MESATPRDIFLAALRRAPTPRPAVGSATSIVTIDLMRHLGVTFPDAHLDPALMADLAAAGHTVLGFDNVMPLFSVWHESAALGCPVDWGAVDRMPDCRRAIFEVGDDIRIPRDFLSRPSCAVALEAIGRLRRMFEGRVAVVGKVFGPWTLGYHLLGVEPFLIHTLLKPDLIHHAIRSLKEVTVRFAMAQVEAGADALCLGDHATRDLCSPHAYDTFLRDVHAELVERIPVPIILHICGDTADRIPQIAGTGVACFHFDSKVPAPLARALAGERMALMGGTSNIAVVKSGNATLIANDVEDKFRSRIDILGPECAVPLDAPFENLRVLADCAKRKRP